MKNRASAYITIGKIAHASFKQTSMASPEPIRPFCPGATVLSPAKGRFVIPSDVLASAGWPKEDAAIAVELAAEGHIRLHQESSPGTLMEAERRTVDNSAVGRRELEVFNQILADRFHSGVFSAKDGNRVTIPQEVVMALLGPRDAPDSVRLFIQAAESAIDVMTHEVRFRRLAQWV